VPQDLIRPKFNDLTAALEQAETHEFLDSQGVPWKEYSKDGQLEDELGTYYILPLVDRVINYGNAKVAAANLEQ